MTPTHLACPSVGAYLVCLAVRQLFPCQQVLVLLIVDLQHAGLHGEAPALLAQEATALKHLHTNMRMNSNRVKAKLYMRKRPTLE